MEVENIQESTEGELPRFLILTNENECIRKKASIDITDSLEIWRPVISSSGKPAVIQRNKNMLLDEVKRIRRDVGVYQICLCTASITEQDIAGFEHLFREIGKNIHFISCEEKIHRERG